MNWSNPFFQTKQIRAKISHFYFVTFEKSFEGVLNQRNFLVNRPIEKMRAISSFFFILWLLKDFSMRNFLVNRPIEKIRAISSFFYFVTFERCFEGVLHQRNFLVNRPIEKIRAISSFFLFCDFWKMFRGCAEPTQFSGQSSNRKNKGYYLIYSKPFFQK